MGFHKILCLLFIQMGVMSLAPLYPNGFSLVFIQTGGLRGLAPKALLGLRPPILVVPVPI